MKGRDALREMLNNKTGCGRRASEEDFWRGTCDESRASAPV